MEDLRRSLRQISEVLASHDEDFEALRQMHLEWLQFQSTLNRLIHLIDGSNHPPISERILLLEEQARRLNHVSEQIDTVKHRLIGLLIGLTISLIATLFSLLR